MAAVRIELLHLGATASRCRFGFWCGGTGHSSKGAWNCRAAAMASSVDIQDLGPEGAQRRHAEHVEKGF